MEEDGPTPSPAEDGVVVVEFPESYVTHTEEAEFQQEIVSVQEGELWNEQVHGSLEINEYMGILNTSCALKSVVSCKKLCVPYEITSIP